MSEKWFLLQSGAGLAAENMAWDETLLESVARLGHPVLRFYAWREPAATFGYSQRYREVEEWTRLRPLIRRPTGGGLVPHDADWTYSLVFPAGHPWYGLKAVESYERVHEWVCVAFANLGFDTQLSPRSQKEIPGQCFLGAEKFDLLWNGRKLAGAAQRRNRLGLLIQGSIQPRPAGVERQSWEQAMRETAPGWSRVEWRELNPPHALIAAAARLAQTKYARTEYNQER